MTPLSTQVVNDYDRDVFNGDQGFVVDVLPDGALDVEFPPAQPSTGGASYGKQPPSGNPADAPGATLANVAPAQSAQAGAAPGQAPPVGEAPAPPQPRRLQYLGRQVMLDISMQLATQLSFGLTASAACCVAKHGQGTPPAHLLQSAACTPSTDCVRQTMH